MPVRRLDPLLVDRIAAGEVVERPASAVKELIENALDAQASRIEVVIEGGGKRLVRVVDDGDGMSAEDLFLAVDRHATSKIPDGDLERIATLGFRGEALPSIASVADLEISTRFAGAPNAIRLRVAYGRKGEVVPTSHAAGTRVEVRDLFAATPARLKFLKSDRAESLAIADAARRLAIAHPRVRFSLHADALAGFDWPAEPGDSPVESRLRRLTQALGPAFRDNSIVVESEREGVQVTCFAGLPTLHRANAQAQYFYVNGRSVRDKALIGAVRAAYADVIPAGRHPTLALFIVCDPGWIDVNVHPAKAEVRFRDPGLVRQLVIGALRSAFVEAGHRASTTVGAATLAILQRNAERLHSDFPKPNSLPPSRFLGFSESPQAALSIDQPSADARADAELPQDLDLGSPLGAARAQLHETYIVAQTKTGVVIVDQHAAHERLVYEKLKRQRQDSGVARQPLLTPVVVDLPPPERERILESATALAQAGLLVEAFGPGAVAVFEIPSLLASGDTPALIRDIADSLASESTTVALEIERRIDLVLAQIACRRSVRSGRRLTAQEMNALLREMEATPGSGQCNHGRPTYVELALSDIERLFGRR